MKNYYEILEIDKNASDEIIKVAYKSLVKKYHPDLKNNQDRVKYEEKIKLINEAYGVLSDPLKRSEYNQTLTNNTISIDQYNSIINENNYLKQQLKYKNNSNINADNYSNSENSNYENTVLLTRGKLISIILTGIIIFLIIKIPFLNDFFIYLIQGTPVIFIVIIFLLYYLYFRNKH